MTKYQPWLKKRVAPLITARKWAPGMLTSVVGMKVVTDSVQKALVAGSGWRRFAVL
jgi:hypothetical protein